jgi:outer membrane receptor protein involved in Fe transport
MMGSRHAHAFVVAASLVASIALAGEQAPDSAASQPEQLQEVTVTGSRVITNGNDSPTPVTVVSVEQLFQVQPTTLSDALNELPQLQGSQTSATSGTGIRNGSAAYLTLRNAGDNHTLVLYDGHRVQPTTSQESHASDVDINVIPQMLIQRVDIVTGGASAVYGSDAVTGVVNFITDTHFNGIKFNTSGGESTYSDDRTFNAGVAVGTNVLDGRGHFEASYEFRHDPGIFNRLTRPLFANPPGYTGVGNAPSPFIRAYNIRTSNSSFGGLITSGPLSGLNFTQNGVVAPFQHGTPTGVTNSEVGGDGTWQEESSLKASLDFHQLFGRFDYDITDSTHGYAQFAGTLTHNTNISNLSVLSVPIGYNNAFLSSIQQPYQGLLAAQAAKTPTGSFNFSKSPLDYPQLIDSYTKYYMALAGLDGALGSYKWSIGLEHSESNVNARNDYNINVGHLLAATNAVNSGGQIVCNAALTNPNYANCVPINLFGPTSESAAALNYVTGVTQSLAHSTLNDVSASLTGAPVSTWAGPANMALSGEWRDLVYHLTSPTTPGDLVDCTGIQFGCTQGTTTMWLNNTLFNRSPVEQKVGEVAYEADVPLVKDKSFFKAFSINAAARYTHYDTSGSVWTWKLGADWHVSDEWTLRATRSRDIRAPNLNDLYNPPQPNNRSVNDLHTNTTNQTLSISIPNPTLVPEVAYTSTAGFVWAPSFIPQFSFTVDAYRIQIHNAINVVSGTTTQVQQACEASGGTSPLCALFVRPFPFSNTTPANFPTAIYGQPLNIAGLDTYGADFEINYAARVFDRRLSLRSLVTWQPHLIYDNGPAGVIDAADAASAPVGTGANLTTPSVKFTIIGRYDLTDAFNVAVLERWRRSMRVNATTSQIYAQPRIPSIAYTNLTLSYKIDTSFGALKGESEMYLNIDNLFNKFPDSTNIAGGDDQVGRFYLVGFRFRT